MRDERAGVGRDFERAEHRLDGGGDRSHAAIVAERGEDRARGGEVGEPRETREACVRCGQAGAGGGQIGGDLREERVFDDAEEVQGEVQLLGLRERRARHVRPPFSALDAGDEAGARVVVEVEREEGPHHARGRAFTSGASARSPTWNRCVRPSRRRMQRMEKTPRVRSVETDAI